MTGVGKFVLSFVLVFYLQSQFAGSNGVISGHLQLLTTIFSNIKLFSGLNSTWTGNVQRFVLPVAKHT